MRKGMETGVTQPAILMERVLDQLAAHIVEDPTKSMFWMPAANMPEDIDEETAERLRGEYREAIAEVLVPAYRKLHDFIRDEYIEAGRKGDGLHALPNGRAWYRLAAENQTTTDLDPQTIHEIGLAEVDRLHGEIRALIASLEFDGDMHDFFEYTRTEPRFYVETREELIQIYEDLRPRVDAEVHRLFDLTPSADYEIRKVEAYREREQAAASYMVPAPDGSRPGIGTAVVCRPGTDATLIAYGPSVPVALEAAEAAAQEGRSLQVVDLRSIVPIDDETVCAAVRSTGRAVVVAEASGFASVASEIVARVTERCFHSLAAPVRRVTGFDIPYPAPKLEEHYLPTPDRVLDALASWEWDLS
jgi:hypothetical protein